MASSGGTITFTQQGGTTGHESCTSVAASPWELSHGSGTPDNGSKYEVFSRPLEEHSVTLAFEDPLNSGPKDWIDTQTDDIKWLQRMVGGLRDSKALRDVE